MLSRTSVNLRYWANSQCSLAGSVGKNEVFTLLDAKYNWFFQTGQIWISWVYAPQGKGH